jgi:F-type H+-transporting ATPase subunit delta
MDAGIISTRYARAIYEYAAEKGNDTALYKEMQVLAKNYAEHPALRKVMSDPTVSPEQKVNLLTTACGIHINKTLQQAVRMVIENGRGNYMENIALMYSEVYRKAKGIVIVHLTTVDPATEKTKEALIRVIPKEDGEQIEFRTETDPDIIGGFILEIEDKRLDASVKNQLRILKRCQI